MPGANDFLPAIGKDRDNRESETRFEAPSCAKISDNAPPGGLLGQSA